MSATRCSIWDCPCSFFLNIKLSILKKVDKRSNETSFNNSLYLFFVSSCNVWYSLATFFLDAFFYDYASIGSRGMGGHLHWWYTGSKYHLQWQYFLLCIGQEWALMEMDAKEVTQVGHIHMPQWLLEFCHLFHQKDMTVPSKHLSTLPYHLNKPNAQVLEVPASPVNKMYLEYAKESAHKI